MTDRSPDPTAADNPSVRHETTDVNLRAVVGFGAGLIALTVAVYMMLWLLFSYFSAREARSTPREFPLAAEQQNRLPPAPRLQTDPRQDLRDLRVREGAELTTYGWIDKGAGVVRIPVEEAMRLTVERGLPARPEGGR